MILLFLEEVWPKMGGASYMMDKKGPFNPYDFDIFKIS